MKHDVIRRRGHMGKGKVVDDDVVVKLEDDGDIVIGRGPTEKDAVHAAEMELAQFRREQMILADPEVVAARAALADATQKAREAL